MITGPRWPPWTRRLDDLASGLDAAVRRLDMTAVAAQGGMGGS